jgi:hypothetical protein
MEKEFIPYEQALVLKELGFDKEICFGRWTTRPDCSGFLDTTKHSIYQGRDDLNRQCLAPLYQQAFRWFREKYGYDVAIKKCTPSEYKFEIEQLFVEGNNYYFIDFSFDTYEKAEVACLRKLIEIVKRK